MAGMFYLKFFGFFISLLVGVSVACCAVFKSVILITVIKLLASASVLNYRSIAIFEVSLPADKFKQLKIDRLTFIDIIKILKRWIYRWRFVFCNFTG